jgi:hypothetical protein
MGDVLVEFVFLVHKSLEGGCHLIIEDSFMPVVLTTCYVAVSRSLAALADQHLSQVGLFSGKTSSRNVFDSPSKGNITSMEVYRSNFTSVLLSKETTVHKDKISLRRLVLSQNLLLELLCKAFFFLGLGIRTVTKNHISFSTTLEDDWLRIQTGPCGRTYPEVMSLVLHALTKSRLRNDVFGTMMLSLHARRSNVACTSTLQTVVSLMNELHIFGYVRLWKRLHQSRIHLLQLLDVFLHPHNLWYISRML